MIVNRYAKKCQSCKKHVGVGQGFAYNNGNGWYTVCASSACHRHLGLKVNTSVTAENDVRRITDAGLVYMPFDRDALPLLRTMPGAKFHGAEDKDNPTPGKACWEVSIKPADLPRVLEVCTQLKLEIPDELRAKLGTNESRAAVARAEAINVNGKTLYEFQTKGVEFLALHDRAFLADDMGLGKTIQAIVALPESERVVVICPASVKYNWRDEVEMWRPDFKVTVCNGENNLKFPDSQEQLRQWTISEFGDCCDCGILLDNQPVSNGNKESLDFGLGVEHPTILSLQGLDGQNGLQLTNVSKSTEFKEPIHKALIGVPDLDSPIKSSTGGFARDSGNRSFSVDNSSNVTDGSGICGHDQDGSAPNSFGNIIAASGQHLSKGIASRSKTSSNGRKGISSSKSFVSSFKLGVSNICPRCSKHIPPKGEIVITTYNTLPAYLSPTKDSGRKSRRGKPIMIAAFSQDQEKALSDTIVIGDEAHLVKNYKAARSKKFEQLARTSKRTWLLSGTPLMNRPLDLFGVLSSGNMNVFGSFEKFLRLFNGYPNLWGGYEFTGMPSAEVPELLHRVMMRRLKSEVLKDLPPKTYKDMEVDLSPDVIKKLNVFLRNALIENGEDVSKLDDEAIAAKLDLVDLPMFSQYSEIRTLLAYSRIPAMLEVVESYEESGTPLVVFSDHLAPIEELGKREGWKIITGDIDALDRRNIVQEFQDGLLKGLALTIGAGGTGITLTRASNVLFVDLNWTPALNIQAEDRLVRIGQTAESILVMRMSSNHPLDRHIQKLLQYKLQLAYAALEASIRFRPLPPRKPGVAIIEETDDELLARIKEAEDEAEREFSLGKLHGILGREAAKVNDVPEPELTTGRKSMLRDALGYMISVCDGAIERDGMGFNKPDAHIARWVGHCLRDEDEVSYRVLERILVRYRRQLKGKFKEIWDPSFKGSK